jgi:hypothetical protein
MEAIIIHPESKEQITVFEALAKAFNIAFEITGDESTGYEAMLKESYQQAKEGKTTKITVGDLWK